MTSTYERLVPFPHFSTITIKDWFRFWVKFEKDKESECWLWIAAKTGDPQKKQYGTFSLQNQDYYAHRVSYFLHNRKDPGELLVLHFCNNRLCVNPAHLSLGDQSDNMKYMHTSGSYDHKGENNSRVLLNEEIVREIRASSLSNIEEAKKYGVHQSTIQAIRVYRNWKYIK